MKQSLVLSTIITFGFAAIFGLSVFLDANQTKFGEEITEANLDFKPETLKKFSLGFDGLIADYYWMNALQYIGKKILINKKDMQLDNLKPLKPRLLYPMLQAATTLDDKFLAVYSYGATVLPAINKDEAIAIITKGIAANPNEWRLYHQLGYIYWKSDDFNRAAEVYAEGAKIKDAPPWMLVMSAKMNDDGGSKETAKLIYQKLFDEAQDTQTKQLAAQKLLELKGK